MPEQPDPREIARDLIADAATEIDYMGIGEVIDGLFPDLADDQDAFDVVHKQVDDLIHKAVVTVTWETLPDGIEIVTAIDLRDVTESEADHG